MKLISVYPIVVLFLLISSFAFSQNNAIHVSWKDKQVMINGHKLDKNSTSGNIYKLIGKESRLMTDPKEPTKLLIFDSLGINFIIDTATEKIKKIDIYCARGRGGSFEASPKKLFTGEITIDNHLIKTNSSIDQIKSDTKIAFEELSPGFYWFLAENEEFNICIAYTNKKKEFISMVYLLMENIPE